MTEIATPQDSFHRTLDAALRRVVTCAVCKSENVSGAWGHAPDGDWYGHCLTCGLRFWHYRCASSSRRPSTLTVSDSRSSST